MFARAVGVARVEPREGGGHERGRAEGGRCTLVGGLPAIRAALLSPLLGAKRPGAS